MLSRQAWARACTPRHEDSATQNSKKRNKSKRPCKVYGGAPSLRAVKGAVICMCDLSGIKAPSTRIERKADGGREDDSRMCRRAMRRLAKSLGASLYWESLYRLLASARPLEPLLAFAWLDKGLRAFFYTGNWLKPWQGF